MLDIVICPTEPAKDLLKKAIAYVESDACINSAIEFSRCCRTSFGGPVFSIQIQMSATAYAAIRDT